jgi:hypothetical protein
MVGKARRSSSHHGNHGGNPYLRPYHSDIMPMEITTPDSATSTSNQWVPPGQSLDHVNPRFPDNSRPKSRNNYPKPALFHLDEENIDDYTVVRRQSRYSTRIQKIVQRGNLSQMVFEKKLIFAKFVFK